MIFISPYIKITDCVDTKDSIENQGYNYYMVDDQESKKTFGGSHTKRWMTYALTLGHNFIVKIDPGVILPDNFDCDFETGITGYLVENGWSKLYGKMFAIDIKTIKQILSSNVLDDKMYKTLIRYRYYNYRLQKVISEDAILTNVAERLQIPLRHRPDFNFLRKYTNHSNLFVVCEDTPKNLE